MHFRAGGLFILWLYGRTDLRGTACDLLGGQGLCLGRGIQALLGHGQHQLDAVFLVDLGGAGVA